MANTLSSLPFANDNFSYQLTSASIDTFATTQQDIDDGATVIKGLYFNVSSGSDYWLGYDSRSATPGTDAPDFQVPTAAAMYIQVISGGECDTGLSFTVGDVGGTSASTNPTNANTVEILTDPQ